MASAAGYPQRLAARPPVTDPTSPASPLLALSRPWASPSASGLSCPVSPGEATLRNDQANNMPAKAASGAAAGT